MDEVAVSQHVLSTFTGEAAQAAVEAVILLVYSPLLHTRLNNILLGFHLKINRNCHIYFMLGSSPQNLCHPEY